MADVTEAALPAALTDDRQRLLRALRDGGTRRAAPGLDRADRGTALPVSFQQRRLFFLDQLVPGSAAYLIFETVRLGPELDVAALRSALRAVVVRHEALRTVITMGDVEPMQTVRPPDQVGEVLEVVDDAEPAAALHEWVRRPFDLSEELMLRGLLVRDDDGWVFGLGVHHIAADTWSVGLLLGDLARCYADAAAGRDPRLATGDVDYPDFAVWQRQRVSGDVLDRQLRYWIEHLDGAPGTLELPADRPRPQVQSFTGGRVVREVSATIADDLAAVARANDATRFMMTFAAYTMLLAAHSGQDDIVVGIPVAGRSRTEFEPVVGFFANTLAIRADLSGDPSFVELLARVRQAAAGAYAHHDLPFERLVERLTEQRDMSRNPLFQAKFALQNTPPEDFQLPGVETRPYDVDNGTSKFDLSLDVTERDGGLHLAFEYDAELFDEATVLAFAEHYLAILHAVARDPHAPVSESAALTPAQSRRVRQLGTGPTVPVGSACVPDLIAEQAAATPDAPAVEFGDRTLTYAALDRRAARFAHHLRALGVGPETRVAVHMNRSTELVVALLGVLKAGGAYVPIDPGYPGERVRFLLTDAAAAVVVTQPGLPVPAASGCRMVELGPDTPLPEAPAGSASDAADPDGLAYIIYTSGSTGRPKGAMISHLALTNRLRWMRERYAVTAADRIVQKTPYSFDVSGWEFFLPLLSGATLVMAEPGLQQDPYRMAGLFASARVTIAHFVPPMLAAFLDQPGLIPLPALRLLVCSGQALPKDLAARTRTVLGVEVENLYGPTEAAIDVSAYTAGSSPCEPVCGVSPIGRPIDNIRLRVLGSDLRPRPVGVPGELYIGGVGVGRGYLGRPGLTAERFVPDPAGPPGAVAYRTGDRARLLTDGNLDFLGRLDSQLKIRGFRVETGEIEAVLRSHVRVSDAVVTAAPGTDALLGYVVRAAAAASASWSQRVLEQWEEIWNDVYGTPPDRSDAPDYAGWRSSRSGTDYLAADMAEWVDTTVAAIEALRPRRVLELGCGTGLLFTRLRPRLERYLGLDLSAVVIDRLAEQYADDPDVEFRCAAADAVDVAASFDVVVLNSVVQYFPDLEYLERVIGAAVRACGPAGTVYIGDVRNLRLRDAGYLWAISGRPTAAAGSRGDWVAAEAARDSELVLDPLFFHDIAARHGLVADIRLKAGERATEMNLFRFDVLLRRAGVDAVQVADLPQIAWHSGAVPLDGVEPEVRITGIPHPQVHGLLDALGGRAEPAREGCAPAALRARAGERGLFAHCLPDPAEPGFFDAVLTRNQDPVLVVDPSAGPRPALLATTPADREQDRDLVWEVREYLRDRLPDYLVPATLTVLDRLPLTPNGKVDQRALPAVAPVATATGYEAPASAAERTLAELIRDLLGLARVGRHDDFFAAGGESIVALLLVNRARQRGLALTPALVFQHPTVARMSAAASDLVAQEGAAAEPARDETGHDRWEMGGDPSPWEPGAAVEAVYPLSPMQHEMLSAALERYEPGLHVATVMLRPDGASFDPDVFAAAWRLIMYRHAIFRTSFTWQGLPKPVQTVWRVDEPPVVRVDLSAAPAEEQRHRVRAALLAQRRLVLDLRSAPQWQITVFSLGRGEYRVLLRFTYLLQDGWSFENVQRELFQIYDALTDGREPDLPALPEFAGHIDWLSRRPPAERAADQAFWTATMKRHRGRTPLLECLSRPREVGPDEFPYVALEVTVEPAVEDAVRRAAKREGVTLFTVLQGAWALLLSTVTGQDDVTFGVVCAGRPETVAAVTEMAGPFNNMLPTPVLVPERTTAAGWLRTLQTEQSELRQHQYVSLAQIRDWAGLPWRDRIYDSYLVFENFPMDAGTTERVAGWEPESGITQTEHPLRVMVWPAGGLSIEISYYQRLFDAATIQRLLSAYLDLVVALATRPDAALGELRAAAAQAMAGIRPKG